MNNPQQPREYDAVLGGNSPSLEGAAVLGGIEGVKLRLQNPDAKVRIAALEQALNYGEQGLDLVIESLKNELLLQRQKQDFIDSYAHLQLGGSTDYTRLRDFLATGNWKEADDETRRVMLVVAKRENEGWLDVENIEHFPSEDLQIIDQLWLKYSDGRFGFSIQKLIYQRLKEINEVFPSCRYIHIGTMFSEKVRWEWRWRSEMTFDKTSPEGFMPCSVIVRAASARAVTGKGLKYSSLNGRLDDSFYVGLVMEKLFSRLNGFWEVQKQIYSRLNLRADTKIQRFLIESNAYLKLGGLTDYTHLRDLLAAGKWVEANNVTIGLMSIVGNVINAGGRMSTKNVFVNFPSADIRIINHLWVKYSNGRFGFSVQKQIYQNLGGTREYNRGIWCKFIDTVVWRYGHGNALPDGSFVHLRWGWMEIVLKTAPRGYFPTIIPDWWRYHSRKGGQFLSAWLNQDGCLEGVSLLLREDL